MMDRPFTHDEAVRMWHHADDALHLLEPSNPAYYEQYENYSDIERGAENELRHEGFDPRELGRTAAELVERKEAV